MSHVERVTLTEAAKALGCSRRTLERERHRTGSRWWDPAKGVDLDALRAAREGKAAANASPSPAKASPPPRRELDADEQALLDVLRGGEAAPLDVASAAMRVASRRLADGLERGTATTRDVEGLAKALQELRRSELGWIDLAEKKGDLVPLPVAIATAAELGRRFVGVLQDVETLLASQVLMWASDPEWLRLEPEGRQRVVRDWFLGKSREFRQAATDGIDELLEEQGER